MTDDAVVLTSDDLPTLRRLAVISRQIADEGMPDEPVELVREQLEMMHRHTAMFIEKLVIALEKEA